VLTLILTIFRLVGIKATLFNWTLGTIVKIDVAMTRRVCVKDWSVKRIRIPIIALRVRRVGHNRISTYETADAGQVVASVHVDEAQIVVVAVAGVATVGDGLRGCGAVAAEGVVAGEGASEGSG